jgi:hypothetical protein
MTAPTAQASVEIEAPIELVWSVMIAVASYGEWNPFIVRVDCDGAPAVGSLLRLHVRWARGGGTVSPEVITRMDAPDASATATLAYRFEGWPHELGLVHGTREQRLDSLGEARTRYTTYERFSGLLARGVPLAKVQDGFERHARALKQRAERLRRERATSMG